MEFKTFWKTTNAPLSETEIDELGNKIEQFEDKRVPSSKIISWLQNAKPSKLGEKWKAERVWRTESKKIESEAIVDDADELGYTKFRISLAPDACELCRKLAGNGEKIFDSSELTKDGTPIIPHHPNCFINPRTPIFTSKGWKGIGSVNVGDLVLTHRGRFRKVTHLIRSMIDDDFVVLSFSDGSIEKTVTLTGNHPVLVGGTWKEAKDLKQGDKIKALFLGKCENCGNVFTSESRKYCSKSCSSRRSAMLQWKDPIMRKRKIESMAKSLKESYKNGTRDRFSCTKNANEVCRKMVKSGTWILQRPEIHILANRKLGEKHNGVTYIEKKIGWLLKEKNIPFITQKEIPQSSKIGRNWFFDFGLKDYKILIECDGSYWHKTKEQLDKDKQKTEDAEKMGYVVLRFTEDQILKNLSSVSLELDRVLMNHNHQYKFGDAIVTKIEKRHIKLPRRRKYNLSVDEDESYIASGLVVHNCQCVIIPLE